MAETANGTGQRIDLAPINVRTMFVEIEGEASLVVHKFSEKAKAEIRDKQTQKATAGKKKVRRDPEAEFNAARHLMVDDDGKEVDGFPSIGVKAAMIDCGYRYMGLKKVDLKGDMRIKPDLLEIIGPPPEMVEDTVRLSGPSAAADLRYRPYYWPWSMIVPVTFKTDRISEEQIVTMLSHAGFSNGLGEMRPQGKQSSGDKGTFYVKAVQ